MTLLDVRLKIILITWIPPKRDVNNLSGSLLLTGIPFLGPGAVSLALWRRYKLRR